MGNSELQKGVIFLYGYYASHYCILRSYNFVVYRVSVRCGSFGRCEGVIFKGAENKEHKR